MLCFFTVVNTYSNRYVYNLDKLGGNFQLIFYSNLEKNEIDKIAERAYELVDSLNVTLSNYREDSEISILNNTGVYKSPSIHLVTVLNDAQQAFLVTNGYFDVSIEPLISFWNAVEKKGELPLDKDLEALNKYVGLTKVLNIKYNNKLRLKCGSKLDLGGIAKGYIIDRVYEFLVSQKMSSFLVEAAGDLRVYGVPDGKNSWVVGVSSNSTSSKMVSLASGQAIATSGKTYRFRIIEGQKYSHIINPKTLKPVTHSNTSSVIAQNATTADYLASAFNIITDEIEIEQVLANHSNAELLLFNNAGIVYATPFFKNNNTSKI